ncbi:hypothetical protein F8S13_27375 [Chloroflexia bacterium SDU3-3]|nr:hypothetical protein F8S13_27375 [Chloroflexia bacterium SDU3-3]
MEHIATRRVHRLVFNAGGVSRWGGHQIRPYIVVGHGGHWIEVGVGNVDHWQPITFLCQRSRGTPVKSDTM